MSNHSNRSESFNSTNNGEGSSTDNESGRKQQDNYQLPSKRGGCSGSPGDDPGDDPDDNNDKDRRRREEDRKRRRKTPQDSSIEELVKALARQSLDREAERSYNRDQPKKYSWAYLSGTIPTLKYPATAEDSFNFITQCTVLLKDPEAHPQDVLRVIRDKIPPVDREWAQSWVKTMQKRNDHELFIRDFQDRFLINMTEREFRIILDIFPFEEGMSAQQVGESLVRHVKPVLPMIRDWTLRTQTSEMVMDKYRQLLGTTITTMMVAVL